MKALLFAVGTSLWLAGCAPGGQVTRIADGNREDGRYIDASAYSAYTRAALLDAAGDVQGALVAYEAAREADPDSADVMTRIGALHCRADRQHPERAQEAFAQAIELDPSYAPAYAARARCLERRGELRPALEQALLAVQRDARPVENTELVVRLLFALGRKSEAWAWLEALVAEQPSSLKAWRMFHAFAEQDADAVRLRRANLAERALGFPAAKPAEGTGDALDTLLLAGDLDGARRAAVSQRWKPSMLALRALEVGAYEAALQQGKSLLLADPSDADAWIAVLVAAEQLHDQTAFHDALRALDVEALGASASTSSARGAEFLAALLSRRVSEEAARAFRESFKARASASAP